MDIALIVLIILGGIAVAISAGSIILILLDSWIQRDLHPLRWLMGRPGAISEWWHGRKARKRKRAMDKIKAAMQEMYAWKRQRRVEEQRNFQQQWDEIEMIQVRSAIADGAPGDLYVEYLKELQEMRYRADELKKKRDTKIYGGQPLYYTYYSDKKRDENGN